MLCLFVSWQSKPVVLFENIYIGDNLESCLAKGTIQQNTNNNGCTYELANNYIANNYFTYSAVKFNERNIVKDIKLRFHENKEEKTAKEVFNFMTKYFCQRYQGMKTEKVSELYVPENEKLKYRKEGLMNIWETNKIKIILMSYYNNRLDKASVYDENGNWSLARAVQEDIVKRNYDGNWVELIIISK